MRLLDYVVRLPLKSNYAFEQSYFRRARAPSRNAQLTPLGRRGSRSRSHLHAPWPSVSSHMAHSHGEMSSGNIRNISRPRRTVRSLLPVQNTNGSVVQARERFQNRDNCCAFPEVHTGRFSRPFTDSTAAPSGYCLDLRATKLLGSLELSWKRAEGHADICVLTLLRPPRYLWCRRTVSRLLQVVFLELSPRPFSKVSAPRRLDRIPLTASSIRRRCPDRHALHPFSLCTRFRSIPLFPPP